MECFNAMRMIFIRIFANSAFNFKYLLYGDECLYICIYVSGAAF